MSEALDRTKRSLDLIPYILEHQGISLDDLALKFNISTDILYEDLNLLFCCGLPGYTPLELIDMNFEDGIVSVSNPQALDTPRKLSKQELLRLHLGLALCSKYAASVMRERIEKLQDQISQLLSHTSPAVLINDVFQPLIANIVEAIQQHKFLTFDYASANSDSILQRKVAPIGIVENVKNIYLEGFESNANMTKSFRLDRIRNLEILNESSIRRDKTVEKYSGSEIQLFISKSAQSFLSDNSAIVLESHEIENGYRIQIRNVSESWLISELFAYAGEIEVLEPKSLRKTVALIAKSRLGKV